MLATVGWHNLYSIPPARKNLNLCRPASSSKQHLLPLQQSVLNSILGWCPPVFSTSLAIATNWSGGMGKLLCDRSSCNSKRSGGSSNSTSRIDVGARSGGIEPQTFFHYNTVWCMATCVYAAVDILAEQLRLAWATHEPTVSSATHGEQSSAFLSVASLAQVTATVPPLHSRTRHPLCPPPWQLLLQPHGTSR